MNKRTRKRLASLKSSTFPSPTIVGRMYMKGGFQSLALGCHPNQVEEFRERQHKAGTTGIKYDDKGNCFVRSKQDYVAHSKSIGICDKEPIHPVEEESSIKRMKFNDYGTP